MDRMLYIAASGAKQDMLALAMHGNNLANSKTTGFKADMEQARSMQAYGEGLPTRVFAMKERPASDFKEGPLMTTGRPLDVALNGPGWMSVQGANGEEGLTRAGKLSIGLTGLIQDAKGNLVMGDNGPIAVPVPYQKLTIGTDGTVSVLPQGAPENAIAQVGRIKLVNPDNSQLSKGEDGLFRFDDPEQDYIADANVKVVSGALEGSNVSAVKEMTDLISSQRHFETQVKLMKTAEENDSAGSSLLSLR